MNPRLVKEADSLSDAGYDVTVLYAYWNNWGTKFDDEQLTHKKWKSIRVGGDPSKQPSTYFLSRILHKAAISIYKTIGLSLVAKNALTRSTHFLIQEAKKHKADLYIGHNLGALPPAVIAAKKHKAKSGFDAEDFHRQEVSDDVNSIHYKITKYIEDKYLPQTDYMTASSPLINAAYKQLYPNKDIITILNVFPKSSFVSSKSINQKGPIKLFWFSQTIGKKRGIETIIKGLQALNSSEFELHLVGNTNESIKKEFVDLAQNISKSLVFHLPIAPDKLISFASQFDIGIASEQHIPFNRDICLTNKVFTYLQAGLAVVASNTTAQKFLLNAHKEIGKLYKDEQSLTDILLHYSLNKDSLLNTRKASLKLGQEKYNWENESKTFLSLVNKTLNN